MKVYKEIAYEEMSVGKWRMVLPSGLHSFIRASDEAAVMVFIDKLLA